MATAPALIVFLGGMRGSSIEDQLAESLLGGEFKSGDKILVTRKEDADNLYFESQPLPKDEGDGGDDEGGEAKPQPKPDKPTQEPAKTA